MQDSPDLTTHSYIIFHYNDQDFTPYFKIRMFKYLNCRLQYTNSINSYNTMNSF